MTTGQSIRSCLLHAVDHQQVAEMHTVTSNEFVISSQTITVDTVDAPYFVDMTETVQNAIDQVQISFGSALIFSKHTTAAIIANEHEPLLLEDISDILARLAPPSASYRHDDMNIRSVNLVPDEPENGHAHCQHLFLGPSLLLPIINGRLILGQWQRIFLLELDRPRSRSVVLQMTGVHA